MNVPASSQVSIDPSQAYVLLAADGSATTLSGGEAFWSRPESELDRIGQGWLVSEFECGEDWPNWEMHPNADEFVYLLAGSATFLMQQAGEVTRIPLQARAAVVVPRGMLVELEETLRKSGIELRFAEMKDPVKDKLRRFELLGKFGGEGFYPTLGSAVDDYIEDHKVEWEHI